MIKAILAVDQNGSMGFNGTLPWPHNPADLAHFKSLTENHVVVMGRNTWDDPKMPKPLVGRTVYVVTNRPTMHASTISGDVEQQVKHLETRHTGQTIWVIGGPNIIMSCLNILDEIHVTHFKGQYRADVRIDLKLLLRGYEMRSASVASDLQSTFIRYEPLFRRN